MMTKKERISNAKFFLQDFISEISSNGYFIIDEKTFFGERFELVDEVTGDRRDLSLEIDFFLIRYEKFLKNVEGLLSILNVFPEDINDLYINLDEDEQEKKLLCFIEKSSSTKAILSKWRERKVS